MSGVFTVQWSVQDAAGSPDPPFAARARAGSLRSPPAATSARARVYASRPISAYASSRTWRHVTRLTCTRAAASAKSRARSASKENREA